MNDNIFIGLINNAALLLSLGLIYDLLYRGKRVSHPLAEKMISGLFIGVVAIVLMATPVKLVFGIIFDTRTILLGLTGLFFGTIPTLLAMAVAGAYRISLGGGGTITGVATIISSGFIGLAWKYCRFRSSKEFSPSELYLFGLIVHVVMILCMFLLPQKIILNTISSIALPVILIYPVCTALLGNLLTARRKRHLFEEALQHSEDQHRTILMTAMDGIWRADMQGRLLEVNESYCRMSGYTAHELLNMSIPDLEAVETADDTADRIRKIMEKGGNSFETRHRRKDGTIIDVEVRVKHLKDSNGQCVAFLRDITDRKRAEREKIKLEGQLLQSQKMEAVGQLAGGVAHDFNNMLGVIIGYAELALMKLDPSQPIHADLLEIRAAAERSAELTRQLLAFARRQTIAPRVIDLNGTVSGMLKMLQRLLGENINLTLQASSNLWPVRVDPSQVDQMLANLCVNARDAISGAGRITIETGNSSLDADFCAAHTYVEPGDYVRLVVSDDGSGMDKDTQEHIFEPFYTTKRVGEGTGLGLATVYGIVKQNNGFINVGSQPGLGTTFTIYLPRHHGDNAEELQERSGEPAPRGHETILLVEDEPAILKMAALILEGQGYRVLTAETAVAAILRFKEQNGRIELLITDVVMPDMNGRDLARELLTLNPELKSLFMSGYTADVIAHQGVLDEGVRFIQKPFSLTDLATRVRDVLDGG